MKLKIFIYTKVGRYDLKERDGEKRLCCRAHLRGVKENNRHPRVHYCYAPAEHKRMASAVATLPDINRRLVLLRQKKVAKVCNVTFNSKADVSTNERTNRETIRWEIVVQSC